MGGVCVCVCVRMCVCPYVCVCVWTVNVQQLKGGRVGCVVWVCGHSPTAVRSSQDERR